MKDRTNQNRPALRVLDGGHQKVNHDSMDGMAHSVIIGSAALAASIAIAHFGFGLGKGPETTSRAICDGEKNHTIKSGEGTSHLLSRIDGGVANPTDALAKIEAMNPDISPNRFESSNLPEGVTVRIPEACFPENANRVR
jgi:hypothetical protein